MSFYVQFLGTGSALPKENAHPSSQYVFCQNRHLLIDCGEGTQIRLRKFGIKIQKIEQILISHLHGDHYFGLVGLLSSMHLLGRKKKIDIYGPPPLENIIRMQLEIAGGRLDFDIIFHPIEDKFEGLIFEDRIVEIHAFTLKHKIPTHGFKINEKPKDRHIIGEKFKESGLSIVHIQKFKKGLNSETENGEILNFEEYTTAPDPSGSYAYCSDTAYYEPLVKKIKGVNIVYHEATFAKKDEDRAKQTKHSTAQQAATIAQKVNCKHLYIGHLSARYDTPDLHLEEARSIFESTFYAEEGKIIRIS